MAAVRGVLMAVGMVALAMAAKKKPALKDNLKIELLEECPGTSYETKMVSTKQNYSGIGSDGRFIVSRDDIPPRLYAAFVVRKCKTLEDKDCERFMSGVVDFCKVLTDKGQFYTTFFTAFTPKFKCPLKKGVYNFHNATLDEQALKSIMKYILSVSSC